MTKIPLKPKNYQNTPITLKNKKKKLPKYLLNLKNDQTSNPKNYQNTPEI